MAAAVEVIGITELPEPVVQQPLRKASPTTTIGIGQQMGPEEKLEKLDELLRQATELGLVDNQMIDKMKRNIRERKQSGLTGETMTHDYYIREWERRLHKRQKAGGKKGTAGGSMASDAEVATTGDSGGSGAETKRPALKSQGEHGGPGHSCCCAAAPQRNRTDY